MNAAIEFVPPSEAKHALDQQGESGERTSWSLSSWSVAGTVVAVLMVFYTLFFAASLLVPIAAAVLLSMLLAPAVQLLERLRVPRLLASAVVVLSVVGLLGVGMTALAAPAKIWIDKTAQSLQQLEQRSRATTRPIEDIKKATGQLQEATQVTAGPALQEVRVAAPALGDLLLSGTPHVVASILSTIILVYFLLVSGDVFLRKLVNVIPTFRDKKRAVVHNAADRDGHFILSAQLHFGECRLGPHDGYRDRPPGFPESDPVGRLGGCAQFRPIRWGYHQHGYACDGGPADLRQRATGVGRTRHLGWSRGDFGRGGHALRFGAWTAAQPGCDLHRHNVVGLALGHRRGASGGAVAGEFQDHLRARRVTESDC